MDPLTAFQLRRRLLLLRWREYRQKITTGHRVLEESEASALLDTALLEDWPDDQAAALLKSIA